MNKLKKDINRIFIFVIFIIMLFCSKSYGAIINLKDGQLYILNNVYENLSEGQTTEQLVKELKKNYGYSESTLKSKFRISTTVSIVGESNGGNLIGPVSYGVKLGNSENRLNQLNIKSWYNVANGNWYVSKDTIQNVLGYDEKIHGKLKKGMQPWKIVIDAVTPDGPVESTNMQDHSDGLQVVYWEYRISAFTVYTGEDADKMWGTKIENAFDVDADSKSFADAAEEAAEEVGETFGEIKAIVSDPVKYIIHILLDFAKTIFGDVPQMLANLIQTGLSDSGVSNLRIDFAPEKLEGRNEDSVTNPNAYIKFSKDKNEITDGQLQFTVKEGVPIDKFDIVKKEEKEELEEKNSYGFSSSTEIPLTSVELYTLATNKVEMVDANFFDKTGKTNDSWNLIRKVFAGLVHMAMYLSMAALLLSLIWCGISIVKDSMIGNSAIKSQEHKEKISKLGKALILMICTLFFEAICIYGSGAFYEALFGIDEIGKFEGPIRVAVEPAGYSFSTTPTGYVRYMADISNADLNAVKAKYVLFYIILAISNFAFLLIMMIRMFLMMLLAVVAFIIIIHYIIGNDEVPINRYKGWLKLYISLAFVQIIIAVIYQIVMMVIK